MELLDIIREQQKGHRDDDVFAVGEQLLEMAEGSAEITEILEQDLTTENMGLKDAARKLKEYANKNHGKEQCFCITPKKAEEILREFYGLPEREFMPKPEQMKRQRIDFDSFL